MRASDSSRILGDVALLLQPREVSAGCRQIDLQLLGDRTERASLGGRDPLERIELLQREIATADLIALQAVDGSHHRQEDLSELRLVAHSRLDVYGKYSMTSEMSMPARPSLTRRTVAEALGTALLVATVIGSGIMGERLAGGNVAHRAARQHDRHGRRAGGADPDLRPDLGRALQPGGDARRCQPGRPRLARRPAVRHRADRRRLRGRRLRPRHVRASRCSRRRSTCATRTGADRQRVHRHLRPAGGHLGLQPRPRRRRRRSPSAPTSRRPTGSRRRPRSPTPP